jgi:hypothetical protein
VADEQREADVDYRWRYADGVGADVPGPDLTFRTQTDAEDWLSANWPDLLDGGIDEVTLAHGDEVVYGPMSLRPPTS